MESEADDVAFAGVPADLPERLASSAPASGRDVATLLALGRAAAAGLREARLQVSRGACFDPAADRGAIAVSAWPIGADPGSSPHLFVDAGAFGLRVGVATGGGDPEATARVRRALLGRDDPSLRESCARLLGAGWRVGGAALPDAADGSLPDAVRPWLVRRGLRAHRLVEWTGWIGEPALAQEIADLWRDVLPVLDVMRTPDAAAPRAVGR